MKRLKTFIQTVKGFALFAGYYLEKYLEEHLMNQNTRQPILITVFAFLGLVAFIKVFEEIAKMLVERWQGLRRIILGDDYIEGIWFNKVPVSPPLYGLLRIAIRNNSVNVDGEQYDQHGALTASWHSEMAKFDGRTLRYGYKATYSKHGADQPSHGMSGISFSKSSGVPLTYNGHFRDTAGNEEGRYFMGFRVADVIAKTLEEPLKKLPTIRDLIAQAERLPHPPSDE